MRNIEYKGKLEGDIEQISSGKELPEGSVMFREPETSDKAFAQGAVIAAPLMIVMLITGIIRIRLASDIDKGLQIGQFAIVFLIALALLYVSLYIHEYIHAFTFPKDIKKQIYVMPQNQMMFVYVEDPVPKTGFIISLLSPVVILGILPFIIWLFVVPMIPAAVSFGVLTYTMAMTGSAVGDYLNAYNCIKQVPKGGKVFNRGWHSYWIP